MDRSNPAIWDAAALRNRSIRGRRRRKELTARRWRRFEPLEPRCVLAGEVLISEIMYHASSQDQRDEFIELFNPGTSPINLAEWRLDSGVEFTFPNVAIGPGQYLAVAADLARFQVAHPGVNNVVSGYTGRLSNSGERIALVNSGGALVDQVMYADEGDWAIRIAGPLDHGHYGWVWTSEHDGGGKSIELVNAALSNDHGQNWAASLANGGTPGAPNSVRKNNIAPLVLDVVHSPAVPHATDSVTVRARLLDEQATGIVVSLFHRVDGTSAFRQSAMFDDGLHGDGLAADGIYAAILLPQPDDTVVEFYVQAADAAANRRTYPASAQSTGEPLTKLLYQVDDSIYRGSQPIYRIVMTEAERAELADIGSFPTDPIGEQNSNSQMNATFISADAGGIEVRYNVGVRNRGKGGRLMQPNSYRVNFPDDRRWHDVASLALNGRHSGLEIVGSMILRQAGVDAQDAIAVAARINGSDLAAGIDPALRMFGSYSHVEALDSDFAENHYPLDSAGNLYRGFDGLVYRGTEPDAYREELHFGVGYEKETNQEADEWQDLIALLAAFDRDQTPDALFGERIAQIIDVDQWIRAIVLHELIGNRENSLPIGVGDDFSLYRGTIDTRFRLIAHDLDTILGLGDTPGGETLPIFRATRLDALDRLLKHPQFAPLYFAALKELSETVLAPENINPLLDNWLGGHFSAADIERAKQFLVDRRSHIFNPVEPLVPLSLTVAGEIPIENDYRTTTAARADLSGTSDAIRTRKVLVNGFEADWTAWRATWSAENVPLRFGLNRVLVQSLDEHGVEFERNYIDILRETSLMTSIGGTLPAGETRWTVAGGPYRATSTITVPAGATLRIDPGVTVFFHAGAGLVVNGGQLLAEGADLARIQFTRTPGESNNWRGIQFANTIAANRISYADQAFGDAGFGSGARSISAMNSRVDIDDMTWSGTLAQILDFVNSSFRVANSVLPDVGAVEPVHGVGVPAGGYAIFDGNRFGRNSGYYDIIDFSAVQQPDAVLQILNNIFAGGEDDLVDLDGCDAYIEGNVFAGAHLTDPANPDTSSAVSGGQFNGLTSRWTIVRNFFYDLDHAVLAKEGAFATLVNNTMVNLRVAAIDFDEPALGDIVPGLGAHLDGNIVWATPLVFENLNSDGATTILSVNHSILPGAAVYPGVGNSNLDPHLLKTTGVVDPPQELKLRPGFGPARGTGPNGRDMGVDVPAGASIGGVPASPTFHTTASLTVGGPEILAYRYRLNGGAWSAETLPATRIALTGLAGGAQTLEVVAQNAADVWQSESNATVATWIVDTTFAPGLRISEVLAQNTAAVNHLGTFPDLIELVNEGPTQIDLADISISDDPNVPRKFVFPAGTLLAAGAQLTLFADDPNGTPGIHLGFALSREGEGVYLFNKPGTGGGLLDNVTFGQQLENVALARRPDGSWGIGAPSFGAANVQLPMGNPQKLRINEWLASHDAPFNNDLIEIYNGDSLPVDLGGLYLTDNPNGWPDRHAIAPLSFVAGGGIFVYTADSDPEQGADHVGFRLAAEQGMIGLLIAAAAPGDSLSPIDVVLYGPQTTNVSQGRTPDGAAEWAYFSQPSFGAANPVTNTTVETVNLIPIDAIGWNYNQTGQFNDSAWAQPSFDDSDPAAWPAGQSAFSRDNDAFPAGVPKHTTITATRTTFYFRKRFTISGIEEVTSLLLKTAVDDGAVVYLNGHEVLRHHMPAPPAEITYATRSTRTPSNWETQIEGPFAIDKSWLVEGENVLAVEVHQAANNDMGFAVVLDLQLTVTPQNPPPLRIVELNYHPVDPTPAELAINPDWTAEDFEFIEIVNIGLIDVNLAGVQIAQAVSFTFPNVNLAIGNRALVVKNPAAFAARYGTNINVVGTYSGALSDTSEPIALFDRFGQSIQQFVYSDSGDWPSRADGVGSTLVLADEHSNATLADNWRATNAYGGSPAFYERATFPVQINEVLTHTDDPLKDAIELYNLSGLPVDISGWYLSDSSGNFAKFRIPDGTLLPVNGYIVFDEVDFNPTPGTGNNFSLDSAQGDDIWLMEADPTTGELLAFVDDVSFPAAANGESFGRWVNGAGNLYPMRSRTLGGENSGPRIGPVVINEIMYHASGNNDDLEYVELLNITDSPIELFEVGRGGWKFDRGIDFTFAPGTAIPARGTLVITRFDPSDAANVAKLATFRNTYGLSQNVPLAGGYAGSLNGGVLDNGGDELRLVRPDVPQPGGLVPYLLVDEVNYNDAAPWPTAPDGGGPALARASTTVYGHQPSNWIGATPSPGTVVTHAQPSTITGTNDGDAYYVIRSGSHLHIYNTLPVISEPAYSFELATLGGILTFDMLGGDDSLSVNTGGQPNLGMQLVYFAGAGANTLVLDSGAARIDSAVEPGGTLNTTVATAAHLSTARLSQNELRLESNSVVTLLAGAVTSTLSRLTLGPGATLDITDNALVIDYASESPLAAIRQQILTGRGGPGVGNGKWQGTGITSSTAAAANLTDAESRSVGFAENSGLPLGPYTTFRGQAVDNTSILIAYTRTADANLDGLVNDDDMTIVGALYAPGVPRPSWAAGDFEFNGFVDDDDATLLGALYNPAATQLAAPAVARSPDRATATLPVVAWSPDHATPATEGLLSMRVDLETFGQRIVRGRETRVQHERGVDHELVDLLAESIARELQLQPMRLTDASLSTCRRRTELARVNGDHNAFFA